MRTHHRATSRMGWKPRQSRVGRHAIARRRRPRALVLSPLVGGFLALFVGVAAATTAVAVSPWSEPAWLSFGSDDEVAEELDAPQNVQVEALADGTAQVSWEPVEGAAGYEVARDGETIAEELTETEYHDTDLGTEDTEYRVRAFGPSAVPADSEAVDDPDDAAATSVRSKSTGQGGWPFGRKGSKHATSAWSGSHPVWDLERDKSDKAEDPEPAEDPDAESDAETEPDSDAEPEGEAEESDTATDTDPPPGDDAPLASCDYYAAPDGSGNGAGEGDAFRVGDFWSLASPGDTLCLVDGTYTGGDSMIQPPSGLSGDESDRITIRALNDGKALIDGEGSDRPIQLRGNSWLVIQGVNAARSSDDVVHLSSGANHNVIRRVVAWDAAPDTNSMVYRLNGNEGNLLEDTGGFGSARKIYQASQGANDNTFRRTWGMWNYDTTSSVKQTFSVAYESLDNTCENCIGTFDADSGANDNDRRGVFSNNSMTRSGLTDGIYSNSGYWGSIAYTLSEQNASGLRGLLESFRIHEGFTFDNVVAYSEQSDVDTSRLRGDNGQDDKVAHEVTEIGTSDSSIGDGWQESENVKVGSVTEAPNVWNGSEGGGARVCHRTVDRELTSEPLWPWPMDGRISEALVEAGRSPVTVTDLMQDLFGEIPAECMH